MLHRSVKSGGLCAAVLLLARLCCAQSMPQAEDASTLHVYVNLVQIPVLVLNASRRTAPVVPGSQFRMTIQGVGAVKPEHVRLEGDDPLAVTLLLDRSDPDENLWNDLPKSLGPLLRSLREHDRVSVLALNGCGVKRFGPELSPVSAPVLRSAMTAAVALKPYALLRKKDGPCVRPASYWDVVVYAASRLREFPGRRIIVALGLSGQTPSAEMSARLQAALNGGGISLFPILHGMEQLGGGLPYGGGGQISSGEQVREMAMVNPGAQELPLGELDRQALLSGGMMLGVGYNNLAKVLAQPVLLARGRYILEFPRPDNIGPGAHLIQVSDGNRRDFIRPAGISVPVAESKEKADPVVEHGVFQELPPETGAAAGTVPGKMVSGTAATNSPDAARPGASPSAEEPKPIVADPVRSSAPDGTRDADAPRPSR